MSKHPYNHHCVCELCRRHRAKTNPCWPDGTPLPAPLEPGFASVTPEGLALEKQQRRTGSS